jgi:ribosomal subunit interface protein
MRINFTHRGIEITQAMKDYISSKLKKFSKRVDESKDVDVVVKHEANEINTEVMLDTKDGKFVKVKKSGSDFYSLVDKIELVIRRELEKLKKH